MNLSNIETEEILRMLEEVRKDVTEEESRISSGWESNRKKVRERLNRLSEYVKKASEIKTIKRRGRPKKLSIYQRTMLFLFTRMIGRSNRDMENIIMFLKPLSGITVSYKYIERLYSDEEVRMALHNLFILLLEEDGVSGDFSGDGTGYSLSITRHYRTGIKKESREYRYSFRIMDIRTGLYVAFGYSHRSEMDAFLKAMEMMEESGVRIRSIRLDRYYSSRKVVHMFEPSVRLYMIPKNNMRRYGMRWRRILGRMLKDPYAYMKEYFMRNLSESGFSSDKRRFGWKISQKREDRREMALFAISVLHNIFSVRGVG